MVDYIGQHIGEISSVVTILTALILGFRWMVNSVHKDVEEIRQDTRETNKRIDALYHYVLTKSELK
jgi:hypothetical protein